MPRGGARSGAGRKRKALPQRMAVRSVRRVLDEADRQKAREERWLEILDAKDIRLRFDALKYLTDQDEGKAVQPVEHSGELKGTVILKTSVPRPARA